MSLGKLFLPDEDIKIRQILGQLKSESEFELRFGRFVHGSFNPNIPEEKFEYIKTLPIFSSSIKHNHIETSFVALSDQTSRIRLNCVFKDKKPITQQIERKTLIDKYDIRDLGLRISHMSEEILPSDTSETKTLFRFRERETKMLNNIWRYDFTKVREAKSSSVKNLQEWLKDCLNGDYTPTRYEIEIELIKDQIPEKIDQDFIDRIFISLHCQVGIVINILSPNIIYERKHTEFFTNIVETFMGSRMSKSDDEYSPFKSVKQSEIKQIRFKQLVSTVRTVGFPELQDVFSNVSDFIITDKADGIRALLYVKDGKVNIITEKSIIEPTGSISCPKIRRLENLLIDGEYIKELQLFLPFDILIALGLVVAHRDYFFRLQVLSMIITYVYDNPIIVPPNFQGDDQIDFVVNALRKSTPLGKKPILNDISAESAKHIDLKRASKENIMTILMKKFYIPKTKADFFKTINMILTEPDTYPSDHGVIISSIRNDYWKDRQNYKWKPPETNSIDFMCKQVPNKSGTQIYWLYVSATMRTFMYQKLQISPKFSDHFPKINFKTATFVPALFQGGTSGNLHIWAPSQEDFKEANKYIKEKEDDLIASGKDLISIKSIKKSSLDVLRRRDPFLSHLNKAKPFDNVICELTYDIKHKRWVFMRFREDKTTEYIRGIPNYGNGFMTSKSVWNSIARPLTVGMMTGKEEIVEVDIINKALKKISIETADDVSPSTYFADDSTVRQKSDLIHLLTFHNYIKGQLYQKFCKNADWTFEMGGGRGGDLHKWYNNRIKNVLFVEIDIHGIKECLRRYAEKTREVPIDELPSLHVISADASEPMQKLILISKNKELEQKYKDKQLKFDSIIANMSIHYMMPNINQIYKTAKEYIKPNGYFIITSPDGRRIFEFLKQNKIAQNEKYVFVENGKSIVEIKRLYSEDTFGINGQNIEILIQSIGKPHEEPLLNYDYLIKTMTQHKDFKVLEYGPFESFYQGYLNSKSKASKFALGEGERAYSFLNSYVIFQKT
jgi:hypothetical protein